MYLLKPCKTFPLFIFLCISTIIDDSVARAHWLDNCILFYFSLKRVQSTVNTFNDPKQSALSLETTLCYSFAKRFVILQREKFYEENELFGIWIEMIIRIFTLKFLELIFKIEKIFHEYTL